MDVESETSENAPFHSLLSNWLAGDATKRDQKRKIYAEGEGSDTLKRRKLNSDSCNQIIGSCDGLEVVQLSLGGKTIRRFSSTAAAAAATEVYFSYLIVTTTYK